MSNLEEAELINTSLSLRKEILYFQINFLKVILGLLQSLQIIRT